MKYMNRPCAQCPFRTDVSPFLHPERAAEIAFSTQNPYSDFLCHKTINHDDDDGNAVVTDHSSTCAGWLAMAINEGGQDEPSGYEWPDNVYADCLEMISEYEEAWHSRV